MASELRIRPASLADADTAADFAVVKRAEYERYSPVFWRRAADARAKHQPFLAHCIRSTGFASFAAERDAEVLGVIIANTRGGPPPFAGDAAASWFVDDFFVADASLWRTAGRALLDRVAEEAVADGAARLIVVCARQDAEKRSFLVDAGYDTAAFWWVRSLAPTNSLAQDLEGVEAIVGPAPPVYDPGGPVALATSRVEADAVSAFSDWAAASGAVLAIVPARTTDTSLANALEAGGYDAASEWLVQQL